MIYEIDTVALSEKIKNKENFILVDCRETAEWNEAHVKEATLLPLSEFEAKYQDVLKDKNQEIVIICRSGKRSMNACMFLNQQGYETLINVEGGILSWIEEGYETVAE